MHQYNKLCISCTEDCKQYDFVKVIECPKYSHNGKPYQNEPNKIKELAPKDKQAIKALVHQCA